MKPIIFGLGATRRFAERVAAHVGVSLAAHEEQDFPDGEHKVRTLVDVRERDVCVIHSLYGDDAQSVNDKLCRLLFFLAALREECAGRMTAVAPYLCYARGDTKNKAHDPVMTRHVAALFEAVGVDRVVSMDVHNVAAFQNAFRLCTDHLEATQLFADHFASIVRGRSSVVVSPDPGGVKRADAFRHALAMAAGGDVDSGMVDKHRRDGLTGTETLSANVAGKIVIIIDDLISTGATMARAARICHRRGAQAVYGAASHGIFSGDAPAILDAEQLAALVVTDTVAAQRLAVAPLRTRLVVLDTTKLFAGALAHV